MVFIVCNDQIRFRRFVQIVGLPQTAATFVPADNLSILKADSSNRNVLVFGQSRICRQIVKRLGSVGVARERIASAEEPSKIFRILKRRLTVSPLEMVRLLVRENYFERAYYAYPLMTAAAQAKALGISRFKAIELGVWTGVGLFNLASLASVIGEVFDLEIEVIGFDTGAGMPESIGWPDHPEMWQEGQLLMPDFDQLRRDLPGNAELIIGNVKETIPEFTSHLSHDNPLGFVALDLDYYSSSESALKVFDHEDQKNYLPATPMYVDDSYIGLTQHEFAGEALAIHMKNLPSIRAIEAGRFEDADKLILRKHVRPGQHGMAWHHCIYFAHMLRHPVRQGMEQSKLSDLHHVHY